MMPGVETALPNPLAFSESSRTLEMLARAPEHNSGDMNCDSGDLYFVILEELEVFPVAAGFLIYSF